MRTIINALAACCLASSATVASAEQDAFSQGTTAFKRGDYGVALERFEAARARGNRSNNLSYNLGVSLYRLGRYPEASVWFESLLDSPQWHDLALFQLGLVAEKQGDRKLAQRRYKRVAASRSEKLRRLAGVRLDHLDDPARPAGPARDSGAARGGGRRGSALLRLAAGYDDNAYALRDELLAGASEGEDSYTDLFAWGQYRLAGTPSDGWRLQGYAFRRSYSEYSSLDLSSLSAGVARDLSWGAWQLELGGAAEQVGLDGEEVFRQLRLQAKARQRIGDGELELSFVPSRFSGGSGYEYLDGTRQRFGADWEQPLGRAQLEVGYQLDLNDRDDLLVATETGDNFYSYSPVRHTFGAEVQWSLAGNWLLSAGSEYRLSTYDGENRLVDTDGVVREAQREADRLKAWLGSQWLVSPRLRLAGNLTFTNNEENFAVYDHDKTEASLGVTYTF
ncbi:tetratricopeptide repeat protein [Microbulbifer sp. YPW16]|uniref:tetratricopeptide repeat protein n=1 Tax=Microbulbifer sp. YPW16 TaxID=2904242 RepID=UPI001E2D8208|nr:tetratricopeptide repeat protein [Microbulbifer sp. YPW16]UHQ54308.1 tetratricopeptide repeat protein [Microbulbifer sp. YPW16]